ncbi:MAG TPA: hypothetical protein VKB26_11220 [Candidatus Acidoferrales bacterium]|nr:hypothetical protein [Candidatus Acidoferrales bacterium]
MNWKSTLLAICGASFILATAGSRTIYAAPPSDACSLLTSAQITSVLGVPVGTGQGFMGKICKWSPSVPEKNSEHPKKAMVTILDAKNWSITIMQVGNGIVKTHVSGLGDDAIYGTTPGLPTVLDVKKGNVAFQVVVFGFSSADNQAKEKVLAQNVLAKL